MCDTTKKHDKFHEINRFGLSIFKNHENFHNFITIANIRNNSIFFAKFQKIFQINE